MKPKEKKSEGLDVRLPYSVKKRFMAATKVQGETASAAVRRFIDGYIAETEAALSKPPLKEVAMTARRNPLKSLAIAGTTLGAMSLAALPSAADEAAFKIFDKNADGTITYGEVGAMFDEIVVMLDTDKSGGIEPTEFQYNGDGVYVKRSNGEGEPYIIVRRVIFGIDKHGKHYATSVFDGNIEGLDDLSKGSEEERIQTAIKALKAMDPADPG